MQHEIMGTLRQRQVDIFTHKSVNNLFTHKLLTKYNGLYIQSYGSNCNVDEY